MNATLTLRGFLMLIFSFLFAIMLAILPLPNYITIFFPLWLPLVVIYWTLTLPHRISLGIAWLLGLLLDSLYGTVLGEHALALTIVAYLVEKFYRQIRMYPVLQQGLCIFVFLLIYQGLLLWVQGVVGQMPNAHWFWIPPATSMIVWPWLVMLLRSWRRRSEVY
jgi:rod shape-determining protein MreD